MSEYTYRLMTIACIIAGGAIGKLVFNSMAFVVLIGGLGAAAPLLYLSFKGTKTRSSRMEKLRSTMMILSGSYIVTEDFLKTVQDNPGAVGVPKTLPRFPHLLQLHRRQHQGCTPQVGSTGQQRIFQPVD